MDNNGIGMTSLRARGRLIKLLQQKKITNQQVLNAIEAVPRHVFLDEALASRAYDDTSLPIGHKQTLSQPYVVAKMTQLLLENSSHFSVLEIGTGSGYQTAILSQLYTKVYSVERIAELQQQSKQRLRGLGYRNIVFAHADGYLGWPMSVLIDQFDAIICTAAPVEVPTSLLSQLAPNAALVIPVGEHGQQTLRLIRRKGDSREYSTEVVESVKFVPLVNKKI